MGPRVAAADASDDPNAADEQPTTAVVAVAVGEGIQRLLRSLGVHVVVAGGQSMNPSTAEILEAVEQDAGEVGDRAPQQQEHRARRGSGRRADRPATSRSCPRTPVVQALAALVSYDPDATLDAQRVRDVRGGGAGAYRRDHAGRARRASSSAARSPRGDWIAVTPKASGRSSTAPAAAAIPLCSTQLIGPDDEIVTVLVGADVWPADTRHLEEHLVLEHPHVEVEVHEGGQPLYPYLIGVE